MEKIRRKKTGIPVALSVIGVFLFCLCIFPLGFACVMFFPVDTAGCYSDSGSYTLVKGRITQIKDVNGQLIFGLQAGSSDPDLFTECYLCGDNAALAQANAFGTEVAEGDTVTVLAALRIFYDGGNFPVIALSANGKEYLSQEVGLRNQAAYSEAADAGDLAMFQKIFFPALAVQLIGLSMAVAGGIWLVKLNKRKCPPAKN